MSSEASGSKKVLNSTIFFKNFANGSLFSAPEALKLLFGGDFISSRDMRHTDSSMGAFAAGKVFGIGGAALMGSIIASQFEIDSMNGALAGGLASFVAQVATLVASSWLGRDDMSRTTKI